MKKQLNTQIDQLTAEASSLTLEKHDLTNNVESAQKRLEQIEKELLVKFGAIDALRQVVQNTPDVPGEE